MIYDLIIVGAGPAGLTAGIYARSKMMNTLILDAAKVGGQLTSLYPEKGIHNFPGFERIQARKLADKLYTQAESLECEIKEDERVIEIKNGKEEIIVITTKDEYHTMSVVIAIGMGLFKPKKMGCEGEDKFEGKGLTYILPVKEDLVGRTVTMFGGGNSAIEMALISGTVTKTTLVHRRADFRADESNVCELLDSRVKTIMGAELKSVNGDEYVESVTLKTKDRTFDMETDLVVINIGISSDLEDLNVWNLDLTDNGLIKVDFDMSTSRHGIFACGDIVDYPGKYKQIITGCGEACTAVLSAYKFVKKPYWA
ncbi:MAG: NAD(P)/FAD-dependent oxidoreductase [Candidatus Methanomethylophilaceae archaeon]